MALPPTIIYRFISESPEETYLLFRKAGLLNKKTSKTDFVSLLTSEITKYKKSKKETTGLNLEDTIARAVYKFLNKTGQELDNIQEGNISFFTKIKVNYRLFMSRLKFLIGL